MCGIAGVVDARDGDRAAVVASQLRTIDHRGPDSWGLFETPAATLGVDRLRVVDLVTGDPPITNEDGSIGVVLNGEIYNFRELRTRLAQEGHTFTTSGDTEVLAHLAESRGPVDVAREVDGMFSFAVAGGRGGSVMLGRDRLGKKPLYYWAGDGRVVFGSEIKSVLAHPRVPRRLDPEAIPAFLGFGYVPTPRTFFDGVRSVPPGHVLVVPPEGPPQEIPYWTPPVPGVDGLTRLDLTAGQAAQEVRSALERAVAKRLIADVPIGAFLSGGMDSSTVVGLMAGLTDAPVRTFTIGFEDDRGFDERPYARVVARRFGTDHTEFVVRPDAVDLVDRLVFHHDQPFGDSSAIPTYLLSELTRQHVTVALNGDGGDEVFAGYERFTAAASLDRFTRLPGPVRRAALAAVDSVPSTGFGGRAGSVQRAMARAELGMPDAFRAWTSYLPDWRVDSLVDEPSPWGRERFREIWAQTEGADLPDRLLHLNLRTYLLDDLLPKMDRMSMAHALEVRSPLLDTDLLELVLRLPPSYRARGMSRKRVLRAAVRDLLPDETMRRGKWGFGIPLDRWFRDDLRSYVEGRLLSRDARVAHFLRMDEVHRVWDEHQAGRSHGHALWALLTLEVFLRSQGW
ncbi:MAG TPA: asparagine synthase (glutamine-hydrolyzing) [Actinomycetota bacterium]|nr:asparagine synthase (glutamine-hydrolyzing) [Actinomycetota bacterium]